MLTATTWLIPPLILITGWMMWSRLPPGAAETDDLVERAFATVLCGAFVAGLVGLLLAELGLLRPHVFSAALGGGGLVLWRMLPRRAPARCVVSVRELGAAALIAVLAAAAAAPASEDLLGGRDPGVYANTGSWLAREGTLRIRADALRAIPGGTRQLFYSANETRPQVLLLGFFVAGDGASGEITPQFLHLLPVYLAIGHWVGGVSAAFLVPPFFGVLAALALFLFVRHMLGVGAATIAAGLLTLNLAQIWGIRVPITEGASQLGVFAMLWSLKRGFDTSGLRWGGLGGIALGTCFLLRVDTLLLLTAVVPALVLLQAAAPQRWLTHAFLPTSVLLAMWGTVHGWLFSEPYMRELSGMLSVLWKLTAVVLVVSIPALMARGRVNRIVALAHRHGRKAWALMVLALAAAFVYGMWVRPSFPETILRAGQPMRTFNEDTLVRVTWYFSLTGMIAALAGIACVGYRWLVQRRVDWTPFLFSLMAFSFLYFWRQSIFPDHPWAMRRYLPVVVPGICVGIVAATAALWSVRGRMRQVARPAAAIVLAMVAWHETAMARGFWSFTEKSGALAAVERIARTLPADALTLFTYPGPDMLVATPLALLLGRSVLPVVRRPATEADQEERRHRFETQLSRWMRNGQEIFYVTADDGDAPYATREVRWEPVAMRGVTVRTWGTSENHPPRGPVSFSVQYHVLRAVPPPQVLPACAPRALRADNVLIGLAEGFHQLETRQLVRYRWARPRARLVFPACDATTSRAGLLRIRASCGSRASKTPCRIGVDVNGATAGELRLTDEWSISDLPIPEAAASAPAGGVDVRFNGPRFVQAEAGTGTDRREVSFQLASVAVVPADTPGPPLPGGRGVTTLPPGLNLITPAAQDIWAVRQFGFHDVEQDGGMFRWTAAQARVIVPLGRSRPEAVRVEVARTVRPGQLIRISANGCPLFDGVVPRSEWDATLSLERCTITGEDLTVAIEADAIRPPRDRRDLAVAMRSIRVD